MNVEDVLRWVVRAVVVDAVRRSARAAGWNAVAASAAGLAAGAAVSAFSSRT